MKQTALKNIYFNITRDYDYKIFFDSFKDLFLLKRIGTKDNNCFIYDTYDFKLIKKNFLFLLKNKKLELLDFQKKYLGKTLTSISIESVPLVIKNIKEETSNTNFDNLLENRALIKQAKIIEKNIFFEVYQDELLILKFTLKEFYSIAGNEKKLFFVFFQTNFIYNETIKKNTISVLKKLTDSKNKKTLLNYITEVDYIKEKLNIFNNNLILEKNNSLINNYILIIKQSINLALLQIEGIKKDIDIEFLHDFRVALRKIRSINELCGSALNPVLRAKCDEDFKRIGKITNKQRDLDSHIINESSYKSILPSDMRDTVDPFFSLLRKKRNEELKNLKENLNEVFDILCYWRDLDILEDSGINYGDDALKETFSFVKQSIYFNYMKLCEGKGQINESSPDEFFHKIRIMCKKLRYLIDFFSSLFPKESIVYFLSSLKKLQTALGVFNDMSVQELKLSRFIQKKINKSSDTRTFIALGYILIKLKRKKDSMKKVIIREIVEFTGDKSLNELKKML